MCAYGSSAILLGLEGLKRYGLSDGTRAALGYRGHSVMPSRFVRLNCSAAPVTPYLAIGLAESVVLKGTRSACKSVSAEQLSISARVCVNDRKPPQWIFPASCFVDFSIHQCTISKVHGNRQSSLLHETFFVCDCEKHPLRDSNPQSSD